MRIAACLVILMSLTLLGAGSMAVSAATPTPTQTLRPIDPTATSVYIYLHNTPTALSVAPMAVTLDFEADPVLTADLTINMYRYFNRDHLIDLLASILLALMGVAMLIKLIGRNTRTNN